VPELPDVETYRRYFEANALHQRIARVHVRAPALLRGVSVRTLACRLRGRRFDATARHGKYLFARARMREGGWSCTSG